jgi:inner membrane protein
MPTVFTHPAVPLALAAGLGRSAVSGRLLAAGVAACALPDLDVAAFRLGIPYAAEFGHRGFSHSLAFALFAAIAGACLFRWLNSTFQRSFWFIFIAGVSHSVLDALTNGGLGIAFLWPWSNERYFAPFQVIQVSPLEISRFFSPRGAAVLWSEFLWVWLPCMGIAAIMVVVRRYGLTLRKRGRDASP